MDLAVWLRSLGLEQYEAVFRENAIDETVLPDLTDQDLEKVGVLLGHRRRLLRAIAALENTEKGSSAIPSAAASPPLSLPRDAAERRQVTVMFCDLVGSTALSARMDPEDLREVISAYQKCVAETAHRFGGFVAKYMGDGVLVYFGYPQAHEDDAERAVRAGLEMIAAVGGLKTRAPLQIRVGIATGLVVVGDLIGSGEAQERGIVGETPNLAARLQSIAEPNTVVVAEDTRKLLGNLFELRDLEARELKGVAGPVRAWVALRLGVVEGRFEALHGGGLTALVGREEESEQLLRRWRRVQAGEGQVVFLSGEPGIGKSHLTVALAEQVGSERHTRLRYFCSSQHTDSALFPIITHLERAAGLDRNEAPADKIVKVEAMLGGSGIEWASDDVGLICELLSITVDGPYRSPDLSPRKRKERTLVLLLGLIEALAARQPVLMIFEDAHWIDPTSQELLATLVERMIGWRVLLVITARPEFAPPWPSHSHITVVALMRLSRGDGATLIDRVAGGMLPAEVADQILSRADGVPLFLEELTKTVLDGDFLEDRNGQYVLGKPLPALAIPTTLHASLMARLDRSALAKEIAQIGAAIGREFSYALLRAVVAIDEATLHEALSKLEDAELASCRGEPPESIYSFRHALVQDTAYSSLLKSRRQQLHRQIAEALRDRFSSLADAEPEIIAHHFTQANLAEPAIEWWTKAGEQALHRSAYVEAVSHYKKAISVAEELGDGPQALRRRLRLQIACGQALISARGHGALETTAAFARARELAAEIDDATERFSVYYGLWAGGYVRGEHAAMEEVAQLMLREIETHPNMPESVVAYRVVGTTFWSGGDYINGRQYLEKAVAAIGPESDKSLALRFGQDPGVSAAIYAALVLFGLGEIDRARFLAEGGIGRALRSGHTPTVVYGQFLMCAFETLAAGAQHAAPYAKATAMLGREHGMPVWIAVGTFYDGWARSCTGDLERGIAELRRGLALCHEVGVLNWIAQMVVIGAPAEADAGNVEEGLAAIDEFIAEEQPIKQRWLDAELHRQRGLLLLRRAPAEPEAAEAAFRRAIATARNQQTKTFELRASLTLAQLWRDQGKRREAHDLLAPVYGCFTEGFNTLDLKEAKTLLDELAQ